MRSEHPRVWVGIDAGKVFHWAHVLDASGTELLSCRVENDEAELLALIEEILSLAEDMVWATDQPGGSAALLMAGRTAVPRHRTLSGAFDWSHDLLGEPERKLFRRLSTFAGGFTLEAVETVGPGDGVGKGDILELLSGLVDQSLVVTLTTDDKALRYGMLEPVRQYAREKLEGSGEAVRRRHAVFFLALAEEAEPGLLGSDEAA
jgi:hypothetical protein